MTNGAKATIAVVIILIIAGGFWYSSKHSAQAPEVATGTYSGNTPEGGYGTVTSTTTTTTTTTSGSKGNTSDASLNGDMSNINTQMNDLQSDSANANESSNQ